MSVDIRFEPDGRDGIIAEGTYIWDAAKRLGIRLPADCEGLGQCDTCAVTVVKGATLLSSLTDAERARLSPERLASGERLACQTRIEHGGELVVRAAAKNERAETTDEVVKDLRHDFAELPLQQKVATLVELEAVTLFQALNVIAEIPFTLGGKVMDLMAMRGRTLSKKERQSRRPVEHNPASSVQDPAGKDGA